MRYNRTYGRDAVRIGQGTEDMVTYREIPVAEAGFYDDIEMVAEIREIRRVETGDFGIRFVRQPVEPYEKDYRAFGGWADWKEKFDVSRWKVFCAFDGQTPVAGAVLCAGSAGVDMLEGRDDLGVLWDLRVDRRYKRRGIGSRLFALVADAAAASGCRQLKIECQNVNVPAVDFYFSRGAVLGAVNRYAYYAEPSLRDEVQFLLYLDLDGGRNEIRCAKQGDVL